MIKRLLAASVMLALGTSAYAGELLRAEKPIEGQYIVVLDPERLQTPPGLERAPGLAVAAENAAVDLAARFDVGVAGVYRHALQGFVARGDERAMARMLKDPRVAFIEEDGEVTLDATQSGATWGLDRSDQRDRPLNGTYVYDYTGSNVRAYVIDSGILASHSDFGGRVSGGYSAINDGRGTSDCNGHGTHVAGTIGGATWGVAKSVRLVPVRVFGCTGGSANSTIIAGIDWVRANRVLPAVANMSLGGGASSATDTATNNLANSGVVVVVAAGNSNANACNYSPARASGAFTVGSTTSTDVRSSFSNYGSCVDIFAPGSSIRSAWYTSTTATNTISGTSMASPHVAGAAALYLQRFPTASRTTVTSWLINNATLNRLTSIGTGSPNRLLYTR
ncbi:S8 family peptidase [Cognatilysobacter tabacisoli]|uniref:S8 family peptidase n=1 Tax=Cognatilysobacter tabacisoli TaxID=2315424 RepID=UPI000E6B1845|nr:S8 family peptidase [Lysobacter tabacisoli]